MSTPNKPSCPLCNSNGDRILWQNTLCRLVLVDEPDYPGYCRVIVNQHVKEMTDLPVTIQRQLMQIVFAVEQTIRDMLQPTKINLASLGNQVPHLTSAFYP